jgi:hypothetical protein
MEEYAWNSAMKDGQADFKMSAGIEVRRGK